MMLLCAHYDCSSPSRVLCLSLAHADCCRDARLRSRLGASLPFHAWTLLRRCRPSFRLLPAESLSYPKFTSCPCHAPLPWSRTPVARPSLAISRYVRTGPCYANGKDSPRGKTSEAQLHGFSARCQCFMPASRLTMHDSLPAVWLQTLPRGIFTRRDAL